MRGALETLALVAVFVALGFAYRALI